MTISYKYPVTYSDPTRPAAQKKGRISPVQLEQEPFEAFVEANGYSFHLLFGSQCNGNFLCIPNWRIGCELSHLSDTFWNEESIGHDKSLGQDSAAAIAYALKELDQLIRA